MPRGRWVNLCVPHDLYEELKALAGGRPLHEVLREAISLFTGESRRRDSQVNQSLNSHPDSQVNSDVNGKVDSQVNKEEKRRVDSQVNGARRDSQVNEEEKRKIHSQVKRMTERQRSYIWRLAKKAMARHQVTMAELRERCREEVGVDIGEEMSRDDASKVISWLKELAGEEG